MRDNAYGNMLLAQMTAGAPPHVDTRLQRLVEGMATSTTGLFNVLIK